MSIRWGLVLRLGLSFVVLWGLAATWMLSDLQRNLDTSLDERLAASAHLVVSLFNQPALTAAPPFAATPEQAQVERVALDGGMACQVASLKGEILVRSHNSPDQQMGDLGVGYHDQIADGVPWRTYTLEVNGVRISTADRVEQRAQLKYSILEAAAVPVLVALLGGLLVLWVGVGQGLAPLIRIRDALLSRNGQRLDPLDVQGLPSELLPLATSQNELLSRIAHAMARERRFTGDAAHELRSPLTAVKAHIQVAQMTDGEASRTALAKAEEGANRLQRIVEQLLLLARVEGRLSFDDGSHAWPAEVARQALDDCGPDHGIVLVLEAAHEQRALAVPAALATAALRNLLDNALRHTPPGTRIELRVRGEGPMACFLVADQGDGIAPAQLAEATRRFWRHGQEGGSGLGLAIVEAIVERFGGHLLLRNTDPGLEAVLCLPVLQALEDHDPGPSAQG